MTFITQADQNRIEEAVRKVELKTRGEIVTVVTPASDAYEFVRYLWAALIALFGAALAVLVNPDIPAKTLLISQLICFLAFIYLLGFAGLRHRLIPKSLGRLRASRFARQQFFAQRVHDTRERCGILLFVSVAEKYVEIIADKGISDPIDQARWQTIVDRFIVDIKAGQTADGFVTAIEACGDILAAHFPPAPDDTDQLPNRLIIL